MPITSRIFFDIEANDSDDDSSTHYDFGQAEIYIIYKVLLVLQ